MAALAVLFVVLRRDGPPAGPSPVAPPGAAPARAAEAPAPSAAARPSPAGGTSRAPARAVPEDPEGELRTRIRARLEASLAERLPDLALSASELDAATDALLRLRRARLELRALARTPENASRLRELRVEVGEASADFESVVELDPIEFTERVSEDEG